MPASSSSSKRPTKHGRPAFRSPHPNGSSSTKIPSKATPRRRSAPASTLISSSASEEDEFPSLALSDDASPMELEHSSDAVEPAISNTQDAPPLIPPALVTRLLHHHLEKTADGEPMRISKEANKVVARYVETFVREAVARADLEKRQAEEEAGVRGDGFLEARIRMG
ncbi:MAG: hypothetical protein L6R37_004549 [Teloschistes peruensis]|nr:MAG: hypothetical protein L6R37_004549 [Teloschistes peruensis]